MKKIIICALIGTTTLLYGSAKITSSDSLSKAVKKHKAHYYRNPDLDANGKTLSYSKAQRLKSQAEWAALMGESKKGTQPRRSRGSLSLGSFKNVSALFQVKKAKTPVSQVPANHTYTADNGVLMYYSPYYGHLKVEPGHDTANFKHFSRTKGRSVVIHESEDVWGRHDQNHGGRGTPVN